MTVRIVLEGHTASYDDPIELAKGEYLSLTGREDLWDGRRWLWAVSPSGKDGWIPDNLITNIDGRLAAVRDYSAVELTCVAGEAVNVLAETHGWAWCRNSCGSEGWLPVRILAGH